MSQADLASRSSRERSTSGSSKSRASKYPLTAYRQGADDGCRPLHQSLRAGDEPRDVLRGGGLLGLLQCDERSGRGRAMDAARDPGGRGALPASGSAGCLALSRAAAPHGQGGTPRGGRDPDGRAVHPQRRARPAPHQLPGPAEDVSPLLPHRGPRGPVRERHVQGPDRARRRDRDRNPRSAEHATRAPCIPVSRFTPPSSTTS